MGFEPAIWHVFSLKPSKASKPSQQLSVSIGLRNCYLAPFAAPLKTFPAAFDGLSLLCHGTSRGRTNCFCWASKLLSAPLKTDKAPKPSQQLSTAFRCFAMGQGTSRSPTSCFCWASKLLSGTSEAPQTVSIGLRNCYLARYLARFQHPLKPSKPCKTLAAAFDGLSLLCHGSSRGPTSCFCWASKLLSGTSEAPQAVSIGLRNCYLARFQHPLKPSNLYIYMYVYIPSYIGIQKYTRRMLHSKPIHMVSTCNFPKWLPRASLGGFVAFRLVDVDATPTQGSGRFKVRARGAFRSH